jgi:hypothetical protein
MCAVAAFLAGKCILASCIVDQKSSGMKNVDFYQGAKREGRQIVRFAVSMDCSEQDRGEVFGLKSGQRSIPGAFHVELSFEVFGHSQAHSIKDHRGSTTS